MKLNLSLLFILFLALGCGKDLPPPLGGVAGLGSTVGNPPSIASFVPAQGRVGTVVTVTGVHFLRTIQVSIGGAFCPFHILSETRIEATVVSGAVTGKIVVTNSGGQAVSPNDFMVVP